MKRHAFNSGDEELRRLERLAASGDRAAQRQLHLERRRRGLKSKTPWTGALKLARRGREVADRIRSLARSRATAMANEAAARHLSTPPDWSEPNDLVDLRRDWIIATFGQSTAYGGDLEGLPHPPEDYVLTDRGDDVPPELEEVVLQDLVDDVLDLAFTDQDLSDEELASVEREVCQAVGVEDGRANGQRWYVMWPSSPGQLTIYEPEVRCRTCNSRTGYGVTEVRDGTKTGDCEACEPEYCERCHDEIDHQDDSDLCNACRGVKKKPRRGRK